jgi:hypothetical protein
LHRHRRARSCRALPSGESLKGSKQHGRSSIDPKYAHGSPRAHAPGGAGDATVC